MTIEKELISGEIGNIPIEHMIPMDGKLKIVFGCSLIIIEKLIEANHFLEFQTLIASPNGSSALGTAPCI